MTAPQDVYHEGVFVFISSMRNVIDDYSRLRILNYVPPPYIRFLMSHIEILEKWNTYVML